MGAKLVNRPISVDLRNANFSSRGVKSSASAACLAASMLAAQGQERIPLQFDPQDLRVRVERKADSIRLSPTGSMKPSFYRAGLDTGVAVRRWQALPSTANQDWVDNGGLALPSLDGQRYFSAAFPDFPKLNGFLRIPTNVVRENITTLTVVLHPTTFGANSGLKLEQSQFIAPYLDKVANVASWYPSAQNIEGQDNRWNGLTGAQASDYAMLFDGITLCKRVLPSLNSVRLYAISDGVGTAIGFAQLHPEMVDGMLLVSGHNNPKTASFVEGLSADKPFRLKRPVPVVGVVSSRDLEFLPHIRKACEWFASANGSEGNLLTNALPRDYIQAVKGPDSTVVAYGDNVRFIVNTAANHVDSLNFSTNGNAVLVQRFLSDGTLPGSESE